VSELSPKRLSGHFPKHLSDFAEIRSFFALTVNGANLLVGYPSPSHGLKVERPGSRARLHTLGEVPILELNSYGFGTATILSHLPDPAILPNFTAAPPTPPNLSWFRFSPRARSEPVSGQAM
jgi:hypothetical protein